MACRIAVRPLAVALGLTFTILPLLLLASLFLFALRLA